MNNSRDMYYEGIGSNLDQCLNYRDGRYFDLTKTRQLQFPLAYIYNHEPCYANRNYNPPLPSKSHKTVVYTDVEFEKYLYMCMMRGTGFIELYYSPNMMTEGKLSINARVLSWAENNYDIIKTNRFFGDKPTNKCVYGYAGAYMDKALVILRNSSDTSLDYELDMSDYTSHTELCDMRAICGNLERTSMQSNILKVTLEPFEMKLIELKYLD